MGFIRFGVFVFFFWVFCFMFLREGLDGIFRRGGFVVWVCEGFVMLASFGFMFGERAFSSVGM